MSKPGVSIITCTNQPGFFMNILNNYRIQRYKPKELIIIINKDSINLKEWRKKVAKHACLVYLVASKKLLIRSPQHKNKFVGFVQGGTLLFRKKVLKNVRFSNLSLGEDVKFLRDCTRKGYAIYATSPNNYVYIRRKDKRTHTWRVGDHRFLIGSRPVAVTKHFRRFAVRRY